MSRKHYIAIAKAFDYQRQVAQTQAEKQAVNDCAVAIAHVLMSDNAAFDKGRFLSACGF